MRIRLDAPRKIDPSCVDVGDEVTVEHKPVRGAVTILRGIIGKKIISGQTRYYMTEEGATLLSWEPNNTKHIKVYLLSRLAPAMDSLFDLPEDVESVRERIAV